MSLRGLIPTFLFAFSGDLFWTRKSSGHPAGVPPLKPISWRRCGAELGRAQAPAARGNRNVPAGRSSQNRAAMDDRSRAAIVADIKQQLQTEMGLLPCQLLRERRQSFVEMYSYDATGASNYGTAGYLGHGYFITVKHGVVALGRASESRRITSVKLMYDGRAIAARIVDTGDAHVEVDPRRLGDHQGQGGSADLPRSTSTSPSASISPIRSSASATTTRRASSSRPAYVGQNTPNNLVTCLTDGHPGRLWRRRPEQRRPAGRASRSAGCRGTTASRSSCRYAPRCCGAYRRRLWPAPSSPESHSPLYAPSGPSSG